MANRLHLSIDRSSPVPAVPPGRPGHRSRHPQRPAGTRQPAGQRNRPCRPAEPLPAHHAQGHGRTGPLRPAGPQARRGTQVVSSQVRRPLELSSLYDDLTNNGKQAHHRGAQLFARGGRRRHPGSTSPAAGAKVYHFTRLRKVGGKPLALMENWVRDDITHMDEACSQPQGLYSILRRGGVNFRLATSASAP